MNVRVTPSPPSSLDVSWQPPKCLLQNSRNLTNYTLRYRPLPSSQKGGGMEVVTGLKFTLTGLASFTNYSVSVSANNHKGAGPWSKVFASIVIGKWVSKTCTLVSIETPQTI